MKPTPALIRQGQVQHLWIPAFGRNVCRSWVGSNNSDPAKTTCEDCKAGRTAEDTVTDSYGRRVEEKGQLGL